MNRRVVRLPLVALLALGTFAYARQEAQTETPAQEKTEQPRKPRPVLDYKKLKEFLPETVAGLKRSEAKGGKQQMGDTAIANAEGRYAKEDSEQSATITITDYGAMPAIIDGAAYWTNFEVDNESDDGHEKTVEVAGFKALERFTKEGKNGSLTLVVGRTLVVVETNGLDAAELKKTAEAMKLKDLEKLDQSTAR